MSSEDYHGIRRVGLTGSIGMGKSTTAAMFAEEGIPVHDADAAVHRLYERGGAAVDPIDEAFPGTIVDGAVDRAALRARVVGNDEAMARLEAIVHPLVREEEIAFHRAAERTGAPFAIFDIPLLFEKGGEGRMDAVVVVTAPPEVQRERVLARGTMSEEEFEKILARQVPDAEKRARASFTVDTSKGMEAARERVREIITELSAAES